MPAPAPRPAPPLLVTGATGTLASAFGRICRIRGIEHRLLARHEMDIADADSVGNALDQLRPWAVVNAAGYVHVDEAERERALCWRENVKGPAVLASACAARGIRLATFSSDLVFDGGGSSPYVEGDAVGPLSFYGRSKAEAEARVLRAFPEALVIRTSAFFGPWDRHNFVTLALAAFESRRAWPCAADATVSPTYVPDLVHAALDLLIDDARDVWHVANRGAVTWADLARVVGDMAGIRGDLVLARPCSALDLAARRPAYSVLGSVRGQLLAPFTDALERYFEEREVAPAPPA